MDPNSLNTGKSRGVPVYRALQVASDRFGKFDLALMALFQGLPVQVGEEATALSFEVRTQL